MKLIKVLLFSSIIATSGILFAATSTENRVSKAQESFGQVLKDTPDKSIVATVFFTNDMSLENVRDALYDSPLAVKGFRHGTQSYSGGYTLKPDETIDEAITNYRRDHLFFLQKRMEIEDSTLAVETDENLRNAMVTHRKEAEQMKRDFDKNGIRVIGIEFHGKAKDIQSFKKKHSFVRVVELKEKGKPQPAILPQH